MASVIENLVNIADKARRVSGLIPSDSLERLLANNVPSRFDEEWKYTNVGKVLKQDWTGQAVYDEANIERFLFNDFDGHLVVLVNGTLDLSLSSFSQEDGLTIKPLVEASQEELALKTVEIQQGLFIDLNGHGCSGGVFLHVDKGVKVSKPVHIINFLNGEGSMTQSRNIFVIESFGQCDVIETFCNESGDRTFRNSVADFVVKDGGQLQYDKVQQDGIAGHHVATERVHQSRDSRFGINSITLGGKFVRNNLEIVVEGENCHSELNGVYLLKGKQHVDNHTKVDHRKAHCTSSELYKGIIDDQSTGVFNGKVLVRENAQKIEAYQHNSNVLLSDFAAINAKPELEIYADDVKCSHGSTTGQLDEEALFYLRSRGISESLAKQILVRAFVSEVIEEIKNLYVKDKVAELIDKHFSV